MMAAAGDPIALTGLLVQVDCAPDLVAGAPGEGRVAGRSRRARRRGFRGTLQRSSTEGLTWSRDRSAWRPGH